MINDDFSVNSEDETQLYDGDNNDIQINEEKKIIKKSTNNNNSKPKREPTKKQLENFRELRDKRRNKIKELKKSAMKDEIEYELKNKLEKSLEIPEKQKPPMILPAPEKPIEYLPPAEDKPPTKIKLVEKLSFENKKVYVDNNPYISSLTFSPYLLQVERNKQKNSKKIRNEYTIPNFNSDIYR